MVMLVITLYFSSFKFSARSSLMLAEKHTFESFDVEEPNKRRKIEGDIPTVTINEILTHVQDPHEMLGPDVSCCHI